MIPDLPIIRDWLEESRKKGELEGSRKAEARAKILLEQARLSEERIRLAEERIRLATASTRESILAMLRMKFNTVPVSLEARIREADVHWCNRLILRIMKSNTLSELDIDAV